MDVKPSAELVQRFRALLAEYIGKNVASIATDEEIAAEIASVARRRNVSPDGVLAFLEERRRHL